MGRDQSGRGIAGIGVDLVDAGRIRESILKRPAFLTTVFTPPELRRVQKRPERVRFEKLAACFAAKEAFYKALGRNQHGIGWKDIALAGKPGKPPELVISAKARRILEKLQIGRVHVSITDEGGFAAAFVILERTGG